VLAQEPQVDHRAITSARLPARPQRPRGKLLAGRRGLREAGRLTAPIPPSAASLTTVRPVTAGGPPATTLRRRPDRGSDPEMVRAVLDEALMVHVGTVRDDWPVVLPMAHGRVGDTLYLHGSVAAGLFRDVRRGSPVCVTATVVDGLVAARSAMHHSMNYRCAVLYGEAVPAADPLVGLRAVTDHNLAGRWESLRPPTAPELAETAVWQLDLATASAKVRSGGPVDDPADLGGPGWSGVIPVGVAFGAPAPAADVDPGAEPPRLRPRHAVG
jgi:nitroimidazol reductase NimA-like FMN-containing flavoprotein (pyridoxamine 5'-phosphate oxidase superfamily)